MTEASKSRPVRRLYDLGERRPVAVTFYPNGVVEFRLKGKRQRYEAHLAKLFRVALNNAVEDAIRQKKAARLAKRAAREA